MTGAPSSPERVRALLLDDDEYALEFLRTLLLDRYPTVEVETRIAPDPSGSYDVYFLDDDFEGIRLAGKLARRIRDTNPQAIVLAFSASLDARTLKELLEAGCSGVCDKKVPGDVPAMLGALDRCLAELAETRRRPPTIEGRIHLVATFRELFREWNRRLEHQE
jgi:CheY-like chemotaxis protein